MTKTEVAVWTSEVTRQVDAERRRIRRAILPALRGLRLAFMSESSSRNALNEYARAIDRATKAPKRKASKGTRG